MSKKRFISLILGASCFVIFLIYINKPNEVDFTMWFEENYNVQCEDVKCRLITLTDNNGDSIDNRFTVTDGYYDNSTGFLALGMQIERVYRSINDHNQFFTIEAKGFFGNFEVMEFSPNKVNLTTK